MAYATVQPYEPASAPTLGDNFYLTRAHRQTVALKVDAVNRYRQNAQLNLALLEKAEQKAATTYPRARVASLRMVAAVDRARPTLERAALKLKGKPPKGVPPQFVSATAWELARTVKIGELNDRLTGIEVAARAADVEVQRALAEADRTFRPTERTPVEWDKVDNVTAAGSAIEAATRAVDRAVRQTPEVAAAAGQFVARQATQTRLVVAVVAIAAIAFAFVYLRGRR